MLYSITLPCIFQVYPKFLILHTYFFFGWHRVAYGILVPQAGIEPTSPAVEVWSPNHWSDREVPLVSGHFFMIHCSIHAWKIPRTEEPGGLQSMGLQRVGHD